MKKALLIICTIMASGCGPAVTPASSNSAESLTRYADKENGVICYQANSPSTLSCVKVTGGAK